MRFELMTSSLPRRRSTPELRGRKSQYCENWSGRRDSNSRPSAWKADALPTELHPPDEISNFKSQISDQIALGSFSFEIKDLKSEIRAGAGGRIRTSVGCEPAGFTARCH